MNTKVRLKPSGILLLGSGLMIAALVGCRFSKPPEAAPMPLSHRVTWSGVIALAYTDSLIRFEAPHMGEEVGAPWRLHRFLFAGPDSVELRLFEYREAYGAYAAFQGSAGKAGINRGMFQAGKVLRFIHGSFFGELKALNGSEIESASFFEKLMFQGEELIQIPQEFAAFPLLGRVTHSERIISSHFLGREWRGPVYTVGYKCHGDTATAFRAFSQDFNAVKRWIKDWSGKSDTLDWGREIHFQGVDEFRRPLILWIFSEGVMGFTGCFDTILSQEYAEKMEKSAILWPKP